MEWNEWANQVRGKAKHVVLFGELAEKLEEKLQHSESAVVASMLSYTRMNSMEEAVSTAADLAEAGDVVLLSPGGTSLDAFDDFARRGETFRQLVKDLNRDA